MPRFLLASFLGLCLAIALHACQPTSIPQPSQSEAASVQVTPSQSAPVSLPAATAAIVAKSGGGLFDPPRGDVRFVVISDLNSVYGSTEYDPEVATGLALLPFWKPDMVLCSGDMVAGQSPTLSRDRIRAMWKAFDEQIAAPIRQAKLPYGFTIGNHDASSALGIKGNFLFQQERDLATEYWQDPEHDPGVEFIDKYKFPFYFTFKFKDIFFLTWDGSSNHIPQAKLAWVEKALASEAAQSAKLRILLGHLPLYAVAVGRNEAAEVMENADKLRAMLEKYKVHTYISGHHHAYYPGHRGNLQLLHMGILGSGPRPLVDYRKRPRKSITVLDVKFDSPELTTYSTFDVQTLKQIKHEELPRSITGINGIVLRRDVEWENLSSAEKTACVSRFGNQRCAA